MKIVSGGALTPVAVFATVFSMDLGFFCLAGVLVFLLIICLFYSGQILEMFVELPYFPFKNTVDSQA